MDEQIKTKNGQLHTEDVLHLLSEIDKNPALTQREISSRINISLGKTNYLLNALVDKGILKIKNFTSHGGKLNKVKYILTHKGFQEKLKMTHHFLKKKEQEYNYIKEQWRQLRQKASKESP